MPPALGRAAAWGQFTGFAVGVVGWWVWRRVRCWWQENVDR